MAGRDGGASAKWSAQIKIYYREEDGHLQPFSSHTTARIVDALGKRKNRLKFEKGGTKQLFLVDLKRRRRIELDSNKEYEIVIEVPSKPAFELIEVSSGRTELLSTLLKDLCDVDFFRSILDKAASPHKIESVEMNPHAVKGGKLYTRFLGALEKDTNENPGLLGEIVDLLMKRQDFKEESSIQYAFHGTPPQNLSSICENGMDTTLRPPHGGDWLGMNADTSLYYCRKYLPVRERSPLPERMRLLVFLLLLHGRSKRFNIKSSGCKVMYEVDHELPIATVDIKIGRK